MPKLLSIYQKLLSLYPEQYRKKYGSQMVQTMDDMLAHESNRLQRVGIWLKEIIVLPPNLFEQHMIAVSRRGGLAPKTLMGFVALALLIPFFISMILDEFSEHFTGQHLYETWLWSQPVLTTWVILLPLISLFISLVTFLLLVLRTSLRKGRFTLRLQKFWLLIVASVLSAGILFIVAFHDSANCWLGNPINSVLQLNKTVQCTEKGFSSGDAK